MRFATLDIGATIHCCQFLFYARCTSFVDGYLSSTSRYVACPYCGELAAAVNRSCVTQTLSNNLISTSEPDEL